MRVILFSTLIMLATEPPAAAATLTMTCSNPRLEYEVRFDARARALTADLASLRVLKVENADGVYMISGLTNPGGATNSPETSSPPYYSQQRDSGSELMSQA